MYQTINEMRFSAATPTNSAAATTMLNGNASNGIYGSGHSSYHPLNPNSHFSLTNGLTTTTTSTANTMSSTNGYHSLSEEEQHLYNHHIIENFVESVREMNDVVLIPSKLKDIDTSTTTSSTAASATAAPPPSSNASNGIVNGNSSSATTNGSASSPIMLNDDLFSYYQMINVVKNDLFEPHNNGESRKGSMFAAPKRKLSRRENAHHHHHQHHHHSHHHSHHHNHSNSHSRNASASNLAALIGQPAMNGSTSNGHSTPTMSEKDSPINGRMTPDFERSNAGSGAQSPTLAPAIAPFAPLTSDQLVGQNSRQLTVQFIHHLHSLYTILEHFTNAADFITERYQRDIESAM